MQSTYHSIKKLLLLLLLIFFASSINAQKENQTDSVVADSLAERPPEETTSDQQYIDTPVVTRSIYFTDKHLQSNQGGPDKFQPRELPDSVIKKLRAGDDFWYVNYSFDKEKAKEEEKADTPFTETTFFQTVLWLVIMGGFAAFVIIYLSNSNVGLFRKNNKGIAPGGEEYAETNNIFEINYPLEIDRAVSNGNFRLAIRLLFLKQLKNLSDKKIIQYKQDRTNFDYLLQLQSTKYYTDFFRLTRNYEYSWYGQFDIDPGKYAIIKNDFENFDRNLSNH
jgi:hypothetical protein